MISVLDHGYVKLIDFMGSDESIVEDARMSTGRGFVSWEAYQRCKRGGLLLGTSTATVDCSCDSGVNGPKHNEWERFPRGDSGILTTLHANRHTTPFETGGELKIEVQAPIMVFREWHRHRTQSYNEFSARYAQMPDLHYLPSPERIQKQSATNKQGSGESFDADDARDVVAAFDNQQHEIYDHYAALVKVGCAKEVARLNTPVSRYSKMRAKTDLHNWLGFLRLRHHPAAQWEIQQYAHAVAEIVKALWPRTWALFDEHDLNGARLSCTEKMALADLTREHGFSFAKLATMLGDAGATALLKKLGVK